MNKIMKRFYVVGAAAVFLFLNLAYCRAGDLQQGACAGAAEAAVLRHLPALAAEAEAVRQTVKFDCGEAALLTALDRPAATANARFEKVVELLEKL